MTTLLSLHEVRKRYGREPGVLDGVSLDVAPGRVVCVLGGNGSGKSTLLRILAGLARPSSGTRVGTPRLGYLPDRFPAGQRMRASAYLAHLGRIGGLSTVDSSTRAAYWLRRLDLVSTATDGDKGEVALRQLSKGNAQKVGLAQALLHDPELLVMDEPFSGLDRSAHGVLAEIIAERRERGAGIVFSEHRGDIAAEHADEVYRLRDGRLRPAGNTEAKGDTCYRVVLVGADPAWSPTGLISVVTQGDRTELMVRDTHCDAVLTQALERGASVREVMRA